jgi:hypothetical protein
MSLRCRRSWPRHQKRLSGYLCRPQSSLRRCQRGLVPQIKLFRDMSLDAKWFALQGTWIDWPALRLERFKGRYLGNGRLLRAVRVIRHQGRIPDLRCKCEVGVRQQREPTFTLPRNSVSFCMPIHIAPPQGGLEPNAHHQDDGQTSICHRPSNRNLVANSALCVRVTFRMVLDCGTKQWHR